MLMFQDYPKLSQTYYILLECLAQDHMSFLSTLEPQVFLYILSSISEGLTALGANLNQFTGLYRPRDMQQLHPCAPAPQLLPSMFSVANARISRHPLLFIDVVDLWWHDFSLRLYIVISFIFSFVILQWLWVVVITILLNI